MTRLSQQDTRAHILDTGERLIHGSGFTALGLSELLREAAVPKGSFYHYFRSKEDFGEALIRRYFERYGQAVATLLAPQAGGTGRSRLMSYFARWSENACEEDDRSPCLAVKLAGEVADLSEPMRLALAEGMDRVIARLAEALRAAQAEGSLAPVADADRLAEALYTNWLGMALRVKVTRNPALMAGLLEDTASRLPPGTLPAG